VADKEACGAGAQEWHAARAVAGGDRLHNYESQQEQGPVTSLHVDHDARHCVDSGLDPRFDPGFVFLAWQTSPGWDRSCTVCSCELCTEIERPHERWNVYRRYQRTLEAERLKYQNDVKPFDDPDTKDRSLAERLASIELQLHEDWSRVLPTPDEVAVIGRGHAGA
jgi:hypothetical protein